MLQGSEIGAVTSGGPFGQPPQSKYENLISLAREVPSMGAKLELCAMGTLMGPEAHLAWMRHWRRVKVEETAAAVKEVGPQNFILATDLGQTGNPSPADGLQLFVTDLMKAGLSKDQIMTAGREVKSKVSGQVTFRRAENAAFPASPARFAHNDLVRGLSPSSPTTHSDTNRRFLVSDE